MICSSSDRHDHYMADVEFLERWIAEIGLAVLALELAVQAIGMNKAAGVFSEFEPGLHLFRGIFCTSNNREFRFGRWFKTLEKCSPSNLARKTLGTHNCSRCGFAT